DGDDDDANSITICPLNPGEEISLSLLARRGNALMHGKWRTTHLVGLKNPVSIHIDQKKMAKISDADKKKLEKICCKNVFKVTDNVVTSDVNDVTVGTDAAVGAGS